MFQSTECYSAYSIGTATLSFNFLHLGLQEYFAARYIACSSDKLLMKTLDSIFEEDYRHAEIIMDKHTDAGVQHRVVSRQSLNTDVLSHTSATMDYDMDFLGTNNAIVRVRFFNVLILHCGITGGKSEAFRNFLRILETFRLISHIPQKPGPCVEYYENGQHMEPENIRYVTKEFS